MKNKFIMLSGLPGSGKSHYARSFQKEMKGAEEPEVVWLSSDLIRKELYGSEEEQGDPKRVFEQMRLRTEQALKEGKTVLYDACNLNSKKRTAFLNNIRKYDCEKICVLFAVPYEICLKRNEERARKVPEDVIKRMYLNFNTPYYFEGWDRIQVMYSEQAAASYGIPRDYVESLMNYEQDNPHHSETLGVHMKEAQRYILKQFGYEERDNISVAALIHDCGKPFTKAFFNMKGEPTEIAHYYQHHCNGAYDALFFDYEEKSQEDILEISLLINLHMMPFGWNEEKGNAKQKKQWGEKIYSKIEQLNAADKASSFPVS